MGDKVFIKITPYKHVMRFDRNGKLGPRFIRPFEVLEWIGKVFYQFMLPTSIDCIHNVFHVLLLHKDIDYLTICLELRMLSSRIIWHISLV